MMRVPVRSRRAFLAAAPAGLMGGALLPAGAQPRMLEGKEVAAGRGAISTEAPEAARIGARALAAGGNAMDAVAAASLACCVLEPALTDLGGYVFAAVVLEGATGRVWSLDANAVAPAAARENMYEVLPPGPQGGLNVNEYGCSVRGDANLFGALAVAVPGMMGGMGLLWERWGRLKWPAVVEPSLRLIADGFAYGPTAGYLARQEAVVRRFQPTLRQLMPSGTLPQADQRWSRPDLGKTLERLSAAGWRDFYEGEIGRRIADYVSETGGILTRQDMAAFQPRVTAPYAGSYRAASVHAAILPNGGISTLSMLHMLECLDPLPAGDPAYWHRLAEVFKLGWRDRLRYCGDPDFARVPVERLLSRDYAAGRVETLRQFPEHVDRLAPGQGGPSTGTIQVSAADSDGNLVAATLSHGGLFGSCVTVPGTGVILGHGMCRFDPHPGRPNSVAGRKRPLNNVAPTILRLPGRDVALGLRGGRRIVSVSVQLCQRVVDYGAGPLEAAAAPRLHVEAQEPIELLESAGAPGADALRRMGHDVKTVASVGGSAHVAERQKGNPGVRAGGNVWAAGI